MTRSGRTWLQNQAYNFASDTFASDIITKMRTMHNDCSKLKHIKGRQTPDVILTTQAIHEGLEEIAEDLRVLDTNKNERVNFGMGDLMFKGAEIFWDPNVPSGRMYFINSGTIGLYYDPEVWFDMTPWKSAQTNLDQVAQILSSAEFVCREFPANGVIYGISV